MSNDVQIYRFAQGIPGFEQFREFEFVELGNELPMKLMRPVEDLDITLFIASPFLFYPDYEWDLSDFVKQELDILNEEDIEIWSVITVPEDPTAATINLLAPIVLNVNTKTGKQLILHDQSYSSRAPLNRQ